nr:ABC transporter ATP-binding protein [Corynebacterium aquatimens]
MTATPINPTKASSTARAATLIDFADVEFRRGGNTLVGPINWQVKEGQRWVVIGPNGAGKTTLITMAAAQAIPSSGEIEILGETIGKTDMRDLRTSIGMTSTSLAERVPPLERVEDLVLSGGYAIVGRWREEYEEEDYEQVHDALDQVGAFHLRGRTWNTLSDGERKRVLIARAIMVDPELLIMDEPGAGLDLGGREDLVAYLGDLALDPDAPAIIMITHHVEEIPEGFTHALLLDEGSVVAQGPIDEVLTSENLTSAYHQPITITKDDGRYFARRVRRGGTHRR